MNKAILVGRLTADPELQTTNSGVDVCRFSLAINRPFKSQNGETQTVKLVSASDWEASSGAEWCEVTEESGGATGSSGVTLHITADPNDGGANRETTVTIKATDGSTCTIKVFQSQY